MSDDKEGARLDALWTVRSAHTGAQYESGEVYTRRGRNEPAPGVDVVDGREEQSEWSGGHANYSEESGRRRKLKSTPASKTILIKGKSVTIYKGEHAVEDERCVVIREVKPNGTNDYLCVLCNTPFTGKHDKVIAHFLKLGGIVRACTKTLPLALKPIFDRAQREREDAAKRNGRAGSAGVNSTGGGFRIGARATGMVDFGVGATGAPGSGAGGDRIGRSQGEGN